MPECENEHGAASISRAMEVEWPAGVLDIAPAIIGAVPESESRRA
jgi:hypothetical protein